MQEKVVGLYDSMGGGEPENFPVQFLYNWLAQEAKVQNLNFNQREWRLIPVACLRQINVVDCGFHMLRNAMLLQMELPLLPYEVKKNLFLHHYNFDLP